LVNTNIYVKMHGATIKMHFDSASKYGVPNFQSLFYRRRQERYYW
jgi:hypothetical protein